MKKLFSSILFTIVLSGVFLLGSISIALALSRGIVSVPVNDDKGNQITLYEESHALVIGVSDYTGGWPRLPGVKEDVVAVRKVLEKVGFHVVTVEDPNQEQLEAAFKNFVLNYGLNPENRLLFYYAGHGHTHKPNYATNDPEEWMGYLVGRDAPDPKEDISQFFAHSLSMRAIEGIALTIEAKHAMFVFDSCFSGTLFGLSRAIPQDIQQRTGEPVRQFITSGTSNQVVPDISIFRRQFISALEGEADGNNDGYVTGSELGLFIEETVTNLSRRTQTPRYGKIQNRLLNKGDFVFPVKWAPANSGDEDSGTTVLTDDRKDTGRILDSVVAMAQEMSISRGERSRRIEKHFKKLKELDTIDDTASKQTRIKLWKDFISLYPPTNHRVEEAKRILKNLNEKSANENDPQKEEIYTRFASLMELDQGRGPLDDKISSWQDFMKKYPKYNSYLDIAQKRIQQLKNKKFHEEIENQFSSLMDMDQQDIGSDKKISAWQVFLKTYPENNPKKDFALSKIKQIEEEIEIEKKRKHITVEIESQKKERDWIIAEREALRTKREQLKQKEEAFRLKVQRLAEEAEARRLEEEERLAEEKRLAEEAEARRLEEERLAEEKRLAEEAEARRLEEERLAKEKRLAEEAEARRLEEERLQRESRENPEVARLDPENIKSSKQDSSGMGNMVLIPAGEYVVGKHSSTGTRSLPEFYIDTHEVSQKEFEKIMGNNPSHFKGDDFPVETVSWEEAQEYCRRVGKRLPTSDEWEKAARGGTASKYYWGNELGENQANCGGCGSKFDYRKTAPVGSFSPNKFGLYDMAGNVWEWIDQTHDHNFKVLRGGSWMDDSHFVMPESSYFVVPKNRSSDIGFRCAR